MKSSLVEKMNHLYKSLRYDVVYVIKKYIQGTERQLKKIDGLILEFNSFECLKEYDVIARQCFTNILNININ